MEHLAPRLVLLVKCLCVSFGAKIILQDVSIDVVRGEIIGLLGPNGSGKSTALHAITGIVPHQSGSIFINGHVSSDPAAKRFFGFAPDDLPLPCSLTGSEFLLLHQNIRRSHYNKAIADELVELLDMAPHLNRPIGDYSHGMRRKIQLVTSLAHRPPFLILDEPLRGLDPEAAMILRSIMARYVSDDGAILLATHDLATAQRDCDRFVILAGGKVVLAGRTSDILVNGAETLEDAFLKATQLDHRIAVKLDQVDHLRFVAFSHETDSS